MKDFLFLKKILSFIFVSFLFFPLITGAQTNPNHVYVPGHYNSNGTYIQGYYKTAPNNTINDNFSTKPNINPYTGKVGTVNPTNSNQNNSYDFDAALNAAYNRHGLNTPNPAPNDYVDPATLKRLQYGSYPRYYCKANANLWLTPDRNRLILTMESMDYVRVISTYSFGLNGVNNDYWYVFHVSSLSTGYVHKSLLVKD